MELGARLQQIREDQGLSQTQFAELVGTSQSTISQIEAGERNPSYDMLRRLATALSVTIGYVLGETEISDLNPEEEAYFREFRGLSESARRQLSQFAQFLRTTHGIDEDGDEQA